MLTEIKKKEEEGTSNENCLFCLPPLPLPLFHSAATGWGGGIGEEAKKGTKRERCSDFVILGAAGKKGNSEVPIGLFCAVVVTVSGTSQMHGFSFSEKSFGGI